MFPRELDFQPALLNTLKRTMKKWLAPCLPSIALTTEQDATVTFRPQVQGVPWAELLLAR